jgi:hypothetical protein
VYQLRTSRRPRILRSTADRIATAYDALWNKRPPLGDQGCKRARTHALRLGYLPPLAWDDIDNPDERPATVDSGDMFDDIAVERAMHGDRVTLTTQERAEATRRLTAAGHTAEDIAARLHTTSRSIQRQRARTAA